MVGTPVVDSPGGGLAQGAAVDGAFAHGALVPSCIGRGAVVDEVLAHGAFVPSCGGRGVGALDDGICEFGWLVW